MHNKKLIFQNNKVLDCLCFIFIFSLFIGLWKVQVNATPQSIHSSSFYLSFINYLSASETFFNDFFLLSKIVIRDNSPMGSLWPAWLISVFGLQSSFLWEPYLLALFILIPISLIPFFFKLPRSISWLFAFSLFYFPPTQVVVKTLCADSYAITYSLIGFLCFRSYLSTKYSMWLFWSILTLWLATISNVIGVITTFTLFQSYLIFAVNRRKYDAKIFLGILIITFCGIPFYHEHIFEGFVWTTLNFKLKLLFLGLTIVPLLIGSLNFFQSRNSGRKHLLKIFRNFTALSLTLGLVLYKIIRSPESISSIELATLILVIEFIGLIYVQSRYDLSKLRSFNYVFIIVCISNGAILSEILVGKYFQLLLIPLIMIFMQSFMESGSSARVIMLLVCLLGSNFFPNSGQLQTLFGNRGLLFSLYGLQSLHGNILGWGKSEITQVKAQITSKLESVRIIGEDKLFAIDNLHFQTRLMLSPKLNFQSTIPELQRLDILPKKILKKSLDEYKLRGNALFEDWVQSNRFPFLIKGINPWELHHTPAANLDELFNNPSRESEIGMSLSRAFINYLETSGALQHKYELTKIPNKEPRVCLYLLKNLEVSRDVPFQINKALSRVSHHFQIDLYSEEKPWWLERIHPEIRTQIIERESLRIYKLGQEYRNQANYVQAYRYLIKANQLDASNLEVKSNLEDLDNKIPKSVLKLLDQSRPH